MCSYIELYWETAKVRCIRCMCWVQVRAHLDKYSVIYDNVNWSNEIFMLCRCESPPVHARYYFTYISLCLRLRRRPRYCVSIYSMSLVTSYSMFKTPRSSATSKQYYNYINRDTMSQFIIGKLSRSSGINDNYFIKYMSSVILK